MWLECCWNNSKELARSRGIGSDFKNNGKYDSMDYIPHDYYDWIRLDGFFNAFMIHSGAWRQNKSAIASVVET